MNPASPPELRLCQADYHNPVHADALVQLLDAYATDPAGGGEALTTFAKENLVKELAARPQAFSVLAYAGEQPVGLINCIEGFSTFACRPLVNVHDVTVMASHRGQRVAEKMLVLVEQIARERGACKLTLEVLPVQSGFTTASVSRATSWTRRWGRRSFSTSCWTDAH